MLTPVSAWTSSRVWSSVTRVASLACPRLIVPIVACPNRVFIEVRLSMPSLKVLILNPEGVVCSLIVSDRFVALPNPSVIRIVIMPASVVLIEAGSICSGSGKRAG